MKQLNNGNYFGTHYQKNIFDSLVITDTEYTHAKVDWHYHENPYLTFLLQGKLYEANKKEQYYLEPGSLLFHNWQDAHYNIKPDEYTRGFHIEFNPEWFNKYDIPLDSFEGSFNIPNPVTKALVNSLFLESKIKDDKNSISIELLALSIFEQFSEGTKSNSKARPTWFGQLKDYLADSNEHLTLTNLSTILDIHPVHISREFHKHFKITLGQYIRYLRVNKAVSLLIRGKSTMTDICYDCGFYDQSHFIRDFKRIYNRTPKRYLQIIETSLKSETMV
jgi:AraC family transcriptional regulator